jgi:hypothetical protein
MILGQSRVPSTISLSKDSEGSGVVARRHVVPASHIARPLSGSRPPARPARTGTGGDHMGGSGLLAACLKCRTKAPRP